MPALRKPTSQLSESTLKTNVGRYASRANEPKPTKPLGVAPKHFTKEQKSVWKELSTIAPEHVLKNTDRWVVELATVLMTKIRTGNFTSAEVGHLRACLAAMGMTPSDRSRVSAVVSTEPESGNDPFSGLLN